MEPQNSVNEISDNQMHHTWQNFCWDFKFRIEKWLVEKWVVPRGSCCVSLNICKKTNWQCKHANYLVHTYSSDLPCLWPRWMPLIISSAGFEGGICSWCAPPRCSVTTCPVCVNNPAQDFHTYLLLFCTTLILANLTSPKQTVILQLIWVDDQWF